MLHIILLVVCGSLAAVGTFVMQQHGATPVVASSLVGLLGAGIGALVSDATLAPVIFAGSFAGMTALRIGSAPLMLAAGAVTGLLFAFTPHVFQGYGGKLGTTAFIATACVLLLAGFFART